MIIMKFRGTSVEDAKAICNVSAIVKPHVHRTPIVVASACFGVTDALNSVPKNALRVAGGNALDEVERLRLRGGRGITRQILPPR